MQYDQVVGKIPLLVPYPASVCPYLFGVIARGLMPCCIPFGDR